MLDSDNNQRNAKRSIFSIPLVVTGRESSDFFWKEQTETVTVSKLGAGFDLNKQLAVGQLIFLRMEMPQIHRCYDYDQKFYEIWAIVQHCNRVKTSHKDIFQIGVAFIGKDAPKTYYQYPLTAYKISGIDNDGFWKVMEEKSSYVSRLYPRYECSFLARIAKLNDEDEEIEIDQYSRTKDISEGGVAVFTTILAEIGDYINFSCDEPKFSSMCIVRNRQYGEDQRMTLHLSFSEAKFPIQELGEELKEI